MPKTLLISHTFRDPKPVVDAAARLAPSRHLELGDASALPPSLHAESPPRLLSQEERRTVAKDSLAWIKAFPKLRVGGRTVAEALTVRSVPVWWWLESPLWFGAPDDPACPPLAAFFERVEAMRRATEGRSTDRVVFVSDVVRTLDGLAASEITGLRAIPFTGPPWRRTVADRLRDFMRPGALRRRFRRRLATAKAPLDPKSARVLLVSHLSNVRKVGARAEDVYVGPLLRELATRSVPVRTCYVNTIADAGREEASPPLPEGGFVLERGIGPSAANGVSSGLRTAEAQWSGIADELCASVEVRGVRLPRTLDAWLSRIVARHASTALYYAAAFGDLLGSLRPEVVAVTNETGYAGRAAVLAARRIGIATLGLQHGLIHPEHIEYVYDAETLDSQNPAACPTPDWMAVDGEYPRRVLCDTSAYPLERVVVTGQMRYEAYPRAARTPRDPSRAVVATQPLPDRENWVRAVLRSLDGVDEIVVKVHPLESEATYREAVGTAGARVRVVRDADLFDLLAGAGLLVTRSSTTIIEAALNACPVIVFNPSGLPDPVPFVELGGALGAYSEAELRERVAQVRALPVGGDLERRRAQFLSEMAFGGREGAAGRVADLIALLRA